MFWLIVNSIISDIGLGTNQANPKFQLLPINIPIIESLILNGISATYYLTKVLQS